MKLLTELYQILLEIREILNRTYYGSWIDPDNNVYPVSYQGHYEWAKNHIFPNPDQDNRYYESAFSEGYVRVYHYGDEITIEGLGKDIKRTANILIPSIMANDVYRVFIEKVIPYANGYISDKRKDGNFSIPKERQDAIDFIKAG